LGVPGLLNSPAMVVNTDVVMLFGLS
jgi:hypothetical protein